MIKETTAQITPPKPAARKPEVKRSARKTSGVSELLIEASKADVQGALSLTDTTLRGLSYEQVQERREEFGLNEVSHEKPPAWYVQLMHAFMNPFIGVLVALCIVSFVTDVVQAKPEDRSYKEIIVLLAMVGISALLRFWQEYRSTQAAEALKAMVRTTASVVREAEERVQEIPMEELVRGDIVRLSAGDMIPADVRLLTSKDLFISQAVLTGESIPVEKYDTLGALVQKSAGDGIDQVASPLELGNVGFMGTNVVSGSATAIVVATGDDTYFGSMAKEIVGRRRALTSFDIGINKVSWLLIRFMFVMVPIVFLINGIDKHDWKQAFLFAVSIAVGLTPEMLPMIVTANLARGAVAMSRRKAIVKRLNSIQNFGAMDILCTDKTGTLTQDKIVLEQHYDIHGNSDEQVLDYAWLNSFHQTGLKNVLDRAVLEYGGTQGVSQRLREYRKIDEIPFDFARRRMSVVVRNGGTHNLLICKGAVDEVLSVCTDADENGGREGGIVPMTPELSETVHSFTTDLAEEGLRVLAVAYKWMPAEDRAYGLSDENEMVLTGFIALLDPPKESAKEAIAALGQHGIAVKIITGDNEVVTRKICKYVELQIQGVLLGKEVEALSDAQLVDKAKTTNIFAKMSPIQKSRVIRALQGDGHTVGYLGDGINDAPALRDADVGISVDTAVDIAKESADIILLEKSLMVLEEGVLEGRRTFGNIIKYIKMTASSNFGNVFSVLAASAFLPFLPMLPIHLLVQNLLYDISQISIPWDRMDDEYLRQPRKWEAGGIARFMIFIGPISSIFDITTYCLLWYVFGFNTAARQSFFHSGWFIEGLLSQTLIVHMIRTQKIPFIQSVAATPVMLLTLAIMAIGVYIPFSPLGANIALSPLPGRYFLWLTLTLLCYCGLIQIVKRWYMRRFNQWL
ncbi:MAG TPA: magnesium-translocating P-type ATPase [Terriglobia bacterium]